MPVITSPNMSLSIPVVGSEAGPQYASDINASLTLIDSHDHTSGNGVPITPAALSINSSLGFNNYSITSLASLGLTAQSSTPTNGSIFRSGAELHFVDGNGNNVAITSGGVVNATSSGISSGTASASFVAGVLVVNAAATTPANIQGGSVLLGNNTAGSKYLTLAPPNAMAANYTVTLPALPATLSPVFIDTSGNMQTGGNHGISTSSGAYAIPAGVTAVTNLSVTVQTIGRPVMISMQSDGSANFSYFSVLQGLTILVYIYRDGSPIAKYELASPAASSLSTAFPVSISFMDTTVTAGSHTYAIYASNGNGTGDTAINYAKLAVCEL